MSVIYDALKKVENGDIGRNQLNPNSAFKRNKRSPFIAKFAIICLAAATALIFFLKPKILTSEFWADKKKLNQEQVVQKTQVPEELPLSPPSFNLSGVFFSDEDGYALINNNIVKHGDMIDGARVQEIALGEVELELKGAKIKLSTKK